jgi:hypothetical protein
VPPAGGGKGLSLGAVRSAGGVVSSAPGVRVVPSVEGAAESNGPGVVGVPADGSNGLSGAVGVVSGTAGVVSGTAGVVSGTEGVMSGTAGVVVSGVVSGGSGIGSRCGVVSRNVLGRSEGELGTTPFAGVGYPAAPPFRGCAHGMRIDGEIPLTPAGDEYVAPGIVHEL